MRKALLHAGALTRSLLRSALALTLLLSVGLASAQESITLTTNKAVGETIKLRLQKATAEDITITGAVGTYVDNKDVVYTIQSPTITITGATFRIHCEDAGLTALDISKATSIRYVYASRNQFQSINVEGLDALIYLYVSNNPLTKLSVTDKPNLLRLYAANTGLTDSNLTLSNLPKLAHVDFSGNALTSLDLSGYPTLTLIKLQKNQLASLTLPTSVDPSPISELHVYSNKLGMTALDQIITSLPKPKGFIANLYIVDTADATEGNAASKEAVAAARATGWSYIWDYAGGVPLGRRYDGVEKPAGFAVHLTTGENGTAVIEGATDLNAVPAGTQLTVKATPAQGYITSQIFINDTDVLAGQPYGSVSEYTFTINEDTHIDVWFGRKLYPVTKQVEGNGEIFFNGTAEERGEAYYNNSITVTAAPAQGYILSALTVNGQDIMETRTFNVQGPSVVKAVFVIDKGLQSIDKTDIRLFPNPASDRLQITGAQAGAEVTVISLSGATVLKGTADATGSLELSLSGIASGSYLVRVGDAVAKVQVL